MNTRRKTKPLTPGVLQLEPVEPLRLYTSVGPGSDMNGMYEKKIGDLYRAYSALPGSSRRWEQSVLPGVTRQTGKLNERSRTTISRSQQQIRTES
jgi:hypothetical protein